MTNGGAGDAKTMAPGTVPLGRVAPQLASDSAAELQALLSRQAPATARTPTPPLAPPSEPTAMTRAAVGGRVNERLDALERIVKEIVEEIVKKIEDEILGLKDQLAAMSVTMDAAARKDDEHDGELTGLKAGLKDAEDGIKRVETATEAAQETANAAHKRLVEELGEF